MPCFAGRLKTKLSKKQVTAWNNLSRAAQLFSFRIVSCMLTVLVVIFGVMVAAVVVVVAETAEAVKP